MRTFPRLERCSLGERGGSLRPDRSGGSGAVGKHGRSPGATVAEGPEGSPKPEWGRVPRWGGATSAAGQDAPLTLRAAKRSDSGRPRPQKQPPRLRRGASRAERSAARQAYQGRSSETAAQPPQTAAECRALAAGESGSEHAANRTVRGWSEGRSVLAQAKRIVGRHATRPATA